MKKTKVEMEKYHCPFSDICTYASKLPASERKNIIEKVQTSVSVYRDEWITQSEYGCRALKDLETECSWVSQLQLVDFCMRMLFTTLKNVDCIAYSLKMSDREP